MKLNMIGAWVLGFVILLAAHGLWFVVLKTDNISNTSTLFWWASIAIAAFVPAYFSPRKKILLGVSMAIPAAVLAGSLNFIYEALGHAVDFPGIHATLILIVVTLPWDIFLCVVGSFAGYFLTRTR